MSILDKINLKTMNKKYEIFFGENGLTNTSANHVANKIKEYIRNEETAIGNISFLTQDVELLINDSKKRVRTGLCDGDVNNITETLKFIGDCKGLAAWLREAIKAKEAASKEVDNMSLAEWAEQNSLVVPQIPTREPVMTEDDAISEMPVNERVKYYTIEAKAATIGKAIHNGGAFAEARKEAQKSQSKPIDIIGEGRDAMVYTYTLSAAKETIDNEFMNLVNMHRELQAELNKIKYAIETKVKESEAASNEKYTKDYTAYQTNMQDITNKWTEWRHLEKMRIQNIKIVIPDSLKKIYDIISKA